MLKSIKVLGINKKMDYPPPFYITEHDLAEFRILSKAISIKKKSRIVKFKRTAAS